jgi:hypothetical chaperone protein
VGLAGDAFDAEIVEHVVAPRLGKGSSYVSFMDRTSMPVPPWIYSRLKHWHHLSFLKSPKTMQFLRDLQFQSAEKAQLEALIHLVEADLGYRLHREGVRAKVALSSAPESRFCVEDAPLSIEQVIQRAQFEGWIAETLRELDASVERLLQKCNAGAAEVDRVFLTGGSSFIPSVRRLFADRFGEGKLRSGDELTAVASGLALRARDATRPPSP